jgi:DNA gyrase/topoisomerase IV subunit B
MTDNFKLLSDSEHIRKRFSMYGGSQVVQQELTFVNAEFTKVNIVGGLLKVINEIIDNSVDEYVRTKGKYATRIDVDIEADGTIIVSDNGRGIPSVEIDTPDGKEYQMVSAFTRARAGSNFDDDNRDSIGMNGVGSMITFVTSSLFDAKSSDGNLQVQMVGKNGQIDRIRTKETSLKGTTVKFRPDYEFFGMETIDEAHTSMIEERVRSLALAFDGVRFRFNKKIVRLKFADYFGNCDMFNTENAIFGIAKSDGSHQSASLVNGLSVKSGTHIDYLLNTIMQDFRDALKRRRKVDITAARLKQHLRVHAIINGFPALKFDSQTKERVTNSAAECRNAIGEFDTKKVIAKLMKNEDLINEICAYTKMQEDLLAKKDLGKLEKKKKVKSDKYFAAIGHRTDRIFVVEGDSASGGLIKCLGRKGNAFYALKGVPLNVLEVSHQKFMANKELSELYSIITMFPEAEICLATDADADGMRITGLVSLFMFKYFPEHLNNGKMKILRTPIAIGKKSNQVKEWAYTFADVNKIDHKLDVSYVKGLGSWSEKDLKHIISQDTMDEMLPTVSIADTDLFTNWFSSSTIDYRKEQLLQSAPFDIMKV